MNTMTDQQVLLRDPRTAYVTPPFTSQDSFAPPGKADQLTPRADHGEKTYKGSGKLRGMNALVTGGDSGIGRAIAICYAREGANVAINYLSEEEDAAETQQLVDAAGVKSKLVQGDLTDETFCESLIEQVAAAFGDISILVNNAARQRRAESLEEFSSEEFDKIMKTNVYAAFWASRAALKHIPAGGSIINTVSIQGYTPAGRLLHYATSKSALIGMTKGMADLAIEQGVRVNAVAPGPVWTPLIPSTLAV